MKMRLLGALVGGLAFSFALPTFAQLKETTLSEQDRQQLDALATTYAEAVNKNDAAAIAALFTEDGKFVTPAGILSGREAIDKTYQGLFKGGHISGMAIKSVDLRGAGNMAWAVGQWSNNTGRGNWGAVDERNGDTWTIRMLTYNETPTTTATVAATPSQTTTIDPEVRQQIEAVHMNFIEAQNKGDAAAIAALFTPDAVQVWYGLSEGGLASGQQAIEKRYKVTFAAPTPIDSKIIQMSPVGSDICVITEYKIPTWKGHTVTIYGRDADTWKIRMAFSD